MKSGSVLGFSLRFLTEIAWWTMGVSVGAAVIGTIATRAPWFALGCLVASGVDVVLVRVASNRAEIELEQNHVDAAAPTIMLAGRILAKAVLLVTALFAVNTQAFAGAIVGALTFDITLAVVGSVIAAVRGTGSQRKAGESDG